MLDSIAAGGIRENRTGNPPLVERAILEILNEYGSLGYEQIAAHLTEPPDAVRRALENLRDRGLVGVLSVGELEGHQTRAASYWRLTDEGREELSDPADGVQ